MSATKTSRLRLDQAVVDQGLADSRSKAQAMIMAGDVLVDGSVELHSSARVEYTDVITLRCKPRFVSRGGDKLAHALDVFRIDPTGLLCCDLGASTGGFTDCLLQAGAATVYAVDVGYGQLDQKLRLDARVTVLDRTNARSLELPQPVDLITADLSFISLKLVMGAAVLSLKPGESFVVLIKPQFEAGRADVGKGGVVRDADVHRRVLREVIEAAATHRLSFQGLTRSPLRGPAGNVEFLGHFRLDDANGADLDQAIEQAVSDAE